MASNDSSSKPAAPTPKLPPPKVPHVFVERGMGAGKVDSKEGGPPRAIAVAFEQV